MEQCVLGISYTTPVSGWLSSPFGYREHPIEGEEVPPWIGYCRPRRHGHRRFADGTVKAVGEQFSGKVYHAQPQWRADDDLWALQ